MFFGVLLPCCALFICAYALLWLYVRRARAMLCGLPTYPTLPFIGNAHQILGNTEYLTDPEDIRVITNASIEKPFFYRLTKDLFGDGLLTVKGTLWKQNIKRLGNIFNLNVVDGYQEVFNNLSQHLVQTLKEQEGSFHTLNQEVFMTTLQAICQTTLGIPDNMVYELITPEYGKMLHDATRCVMARGSNILYLIDPIYRLTPAYKKLMRQISAWHGVCDKMLALNRAERKSRSVKNSRYTPFIDILLEMQEQDPSISDEYLKSEIMNIILGGYDTVGTTILLSLLMLGCHPEVQEKVYVEINSVLGDTKRSLTKEDRAQMTYTEAVVKETLRLIPPVPLFMRAADRDIKIQSCTIPEGTCCCVGIWGTHRLKKYWGEDADTFRPERWLEHDYPDNAPYFIPFSYGRRTCIGKRYAMPLVKTVLAYCIQDLIFEADVQQMVLSLDITARPSRGVSVNIRPRHTPLSVTSL